MKKLALYLTKEYQKTFFQSLLAPFHQVQLQKVLLFKGQIKPKVFNTEININDRGDIKKANGSRYFDSEGIGIINLDLIKNGILQDYLIDTYNGKKLTESLMVEQAVQQICILKTDLKLLMS